MNKSEIARQMGRHRSVIGWEIQRNSVVKNRYIAVYANENTKYGKSVTPLLEAWD